MVPNEDAIEKARETLPYGESVEAIVVEDAGDWTVTLNIGWADELVCTCAFREHAVGIAYALDALYGCGVYEDGELL